MSHHRLRIRNATQLVCICRNGEEFKTGKEMDDVCVLENATVIVDGNGRIFDLGPAEEMAAKYAQDNFETDIDATGHCVVPGLCDGHTHPVWSGDRCHEFMMKLAGATYMDIHKAGGGIGYTVRHTRNSSQEELLESFLTRLDRMLTSGTTLVEAKSGYGLETETEMKMLKVIHRANQLHPVDIVASFCGAHSVPEGLNAAQATDKVINEMIPKLMELNQAGETSAELIDVFCEKNVFEREDTRRILKAGREAGLSINFHGDELNPLETGVLGAEEGARAISHLEHLSDAGIAAMAEKGVIGVLLPTTAYILHLQNPPARKMIEGGVPVALGSDYNPNAHCLSLPFVMNLAAVNFRMTLNEALVACTINAAASMNRSQTHGSIEKGKVGDFLVLRAPRWEHLVYQMVDPPIVHVVKNGRVVHTNAARPHFTAV
eukprot:GILI01009230.1.p2 GENE.GILI01009230.1~~GILI01009230.1.p2  ORF type:complete len:433 (-),score=120.57 GILI01009230.1:201-1499(-)